MMRKIISFIFILFYLPFFSLADTYPDVIFDNSLSLGSYAKSSVKYNGGSWVENLNNKLLVSDSLFFTPGNALSLKYLSAENSSWESKVNYGRQKNPYRYHEKDRLSFFIYVKNNQTKIKDLPRIYISHAKGATDTLLLDKYISNYSVGKWIRVQIPCSDFSSIDESQAILGLGLVQHASSSVEHHLFLDQIEFLSSSFKEVKLNSPAILTDAIPYDRVIHLKWQLPLTPSIRYVKIYRSSNGKDFSAVGIRPIYSQSCLDVVPLVGEKYYYKIAWLDYNYKESPVSVVKEAQTKSLSDNSIIELIQAAHINFFVENFDINSGMYMPYRTKDKAIVSTKETGGAILALLVGAEKKLVPRNVVLQRISKITYFLLKAQNKYGIYPAYFDGRKGLPEYRRGVDSYNVQATATLIEALLVAREYFNGTDEVEKDVRNRITSLYNQINWLNLMESNGLLKSKFSLLQEDVISFKATPIIPLNGPNECLNTYLLAISSPQFPLPASSYHSAVYNTFGLERVAQIEEFDSDVYVDDVTSLGNQNNTFSVTFVDTLNKKSIFSTTNRFGVSLPFGESIGSLMDLYRPFLTINPILVSDSLVNWSSVLKSYVDYTKRRDNQFGIGSTSSDIWGFYLHRDSTLNYRLNPAVGPSSMIVDYNQGKEAALALYKQYGYKLLTEYGFRSWLDLKDHDESEEYLAMNQSTLVVMLENAKTGLIWKLYEKIPELQKGRSKVFSKNTL